MCRALGSPLIEAHYRFTFALFKRLFLYAEKGFSIPPSPLYPTFSKSRSTNHYREVCIPSPNPIHTIGMRSVFNVQTTGRGTALFSVATMQPETESVISIALPTSNERRSPCASDLQQFPPTRHAPHAEQPARPARRRVPNAVQNCRQAPCPFPMSAHRVRRGHRAPLKPRVHRVRRVRLRLPAASKQYVSC